MAKREKCVVTGCKATATGYSPAFLDPCCYHHGVTLLGGFTPLPLICEYLDQVSAEEAREKRDA